MHKGHLSDGDKRPTGWLKIRGKEKSEEKSE